MPNDEDIYAVPAGEALAALAIQGYERLEPPILSIPGFSLYTYRDVAHPHNKFYVFANDRESEVYILRRVKREDFLSGEGQKGGR
jgi:hypothetical protein